MYINKYTPSNCVKSTYNLNIPNVFLPNNLNSKYMNLISIKIKHSKIHLGELIKLKQNYSYRANFPFNTKQTL